MIVVAWLRTIQTTFRCVSQMKEEALSHAGTALLDLEVVFYQQILNLS